MSERDVQNELFRLHGLGQKLMQMGDCPGFSDQTGCPGHPNPRIDWVIAGGESGHKARPMHPDWVRSLRDQCEVAGVPFFFKQWGEWAPGENVDHAVTRTERVADLLNGEWSYYSLTPKQSEEMHCDDQPDVYRGGKHSNGRLMDGREWNGLPEVAK
jgi:hypothetical protein